jgi:hydroxymethylpyrimidine kinase/phosphomethylpyrimidine kinase/thiamine-phosphate diphosphorylase
VLAPHYPLTAIGGIDQERAPQVAATGVGSIAVVRAITEAADYRLAVRTLTRQLQGESAA